MTTMKDAHYAARLPTGTARLPKPSSGRCRGCKRYADELGDGLCLRCWDRGAEVEDQRRRR